jgi:hypothetical protein
MFIDLKQENGTKTIGPFDKGTIEGETLLAVKRLPFSTAMKVFGPRIGALTR